jgi:hypothetical protein
LYPGRDAGCDNFQPASALVRAITGKDETCVPYNVQSRCTLPEEGFQVFKLCFFAIAWQGTADRDNFFRVIPCASVAIRILPVVTTCMETGW